jgi:hypothetical protein
MCDFKQISTDIIFIELQDSWFRDQIDGFDNMRQIVINSASQEKYMINKQHFYIILGQVYKLYLKWSERLEKMYKQIEDSDRDDLIKRFEILTLSSFEYKENFTSLLNGSL